MRRRKKGRKGGEQRKFKLGGWVVGMGGAGKARMGERAKAWIG